MGDSSESEDSYVCFLDKIMPPPEEPVWLSTPQVLSKMKSAPWGRDDGSEYGAATNWNPIKKEYYLEPLWEDDYDLYRQYEKMLKRQKEKEKTIEGLDELIAAHESELAFDKKERDSFRQQRLLPIDATAQKNEFDDSVREILSARLLMDWQNQHNVRKTQKELSALYMKRCELEEQQIATEFLVSPEEEDDYAIRRKLRFDSFNESYNK